MAFTLDSVSQGAAALLNDSAQTLFTFPVLLPFMKKSYEEMTLTLDSYGVQFQTAATTSPIAVPVGTTILTTPADFLYPLKIEERNQGDADSIPFEGMEERDFSVNIQKTNRLRFWSWNGDLVRFAGATAPKEVLLYYVRLFVTPDQPDDLITVQRVNLYLESRTAAIAALMILQDEARAQALDGDASKWLDMTVRVFVRTKGALYARRRPFGKRWTTPKRVIIS